jgi:hypothetical protein
MRECRRGEGSTATAAACQGMDSAAWAEQARVGSGRNPELDGRAVVRSAVRV